MSRRGRRPALLVAQNPGRGRQSNGVSRAIGSDDLERTNQASAVAVGAVVVRTPEKADVPRRGPGEREPGPTREPTRGTGYVEVVLRRSVVDDYHVPPCTERRDACAARRAERDRGVRSDGADELPQGGRSRRSGHGPRA